jgi:histidine phosphotransferase ChpT
MATNPGDDTRGPLHAAELICARLCHDLASVAGTLDNVLDLAAGETAPLSEAMALAREAAAELVARLRLLRAAWGPPEETMTVVAMRALATGLPNARRITLDTAALAPETDFPPEAARIVLNLLLLAQESLPAGGTVRLAGCAGDLLIVIAGERAGWPAMLPRCLAGEAAAAAALLDARTLQAPLTALLARRAGIPLGMLVQAGRSDAPAPLRLGPICTGDK